MKKKSVFLAMALSGILILSGCGSTAGNNSATGGSNSATESSTAADSASNTGGKKLKLSMGIGGTGGAKSFYMGGIAKIVDQFVEGVELVGEASAGAATELAMMRSGDMQFCMMTADATHDAYYSETDPYKDLRCLFGSYVNTFIITTKDPKASNITDYDGKIIVVGPLGGSPDITSRKVLPLLGVEPKEFVNMDFDQSFTAVAEGNAYGYSGCSGHPTAAIFEAETKMDINWIRFTEEQIDKVLAEWPYYAKASLDGDMYKGFNGEDYESFGIWQCVYSPKDIDDDVIYNITKAVMENRDMLIDASAVAAATSLEAGLNQTVPLHNGAYRYYVEKGIQVPDHLIPPEAK